MQKTQEMCLWSLGQENALEKEMEPLPVFLLGKSHEQRSLIDWSPRGSRESDTTDRLRMYNQKIIRIITTDLKAAKT